QRSIEPEMERGPRLVPREIQGSGDAAHPEEYTGTRRAERSAAAEAEQVEC
ncbi:hypothetical protein V502_09925, partial [Pseudogymnoascus sp. VKM F-4520 (FW-2644)]